MKLIYFLLPCLINCFTLPSINIKQITKNYMCKDSLDCSYPYKCCNYFFFKICCIDHEQQSKPILVKSLPIINYQDNYEMLLAVEL